MSLKNIDLKQSYESVEDDLVKDFYEPVLNEAVNYDRIAGFFTSSSFAVSAKGIYNLIQNNGTMRLLVSPRLSKGDIEALEKSENFSEDVLVNNINKEFFLEEKEVIKYHHKLLTWLLKKGYLEMKIVLIKEKGKYLSGDEIESRGIFHQKVGIIYDSDNNIITFSGSINETLFAWKKNIEEFKVFRSWDKNQLKYCEIDIKKFDDYWNGSRDNVEIKNISETLKEKLITYAPNDEEDLNYYIRKAKNYEKNKTLLINEEPESHKKISLFSYQEEARKKWLDSNKSMIFEMATGSGKTRTAISCVESSLNENNKKIVIISTPQSTLSRQWQKEVTNLLNVFDEMIIVDGTTRWRKELENKLLKINVGVIDNVVIFTTHDTVSSKDFINLIKRNKSKDHSIIFIGDEVHALGSGKRKRALLDIYNERIGLSATPSRWFDDEGTNVLISYFNKCKFEFTIRDALKTINPLTGKTFLSKYYYNPIFVQLIGEEEEKYMELTTKINKNYYLKSKDDENSYLDKLIRDRADIIKNAENKMIALEKLLISIGSQYIKNTIIFVSHSQINKTINILNKLKIRSHKYTQEEGRRAEKKYGGKSERDYIIEMFKKGNLKVLVAMKCLDEGIDIPSADTAILVSSTTNPREYIQRIGRVIRQYDGKNRAHIYDMIVNPSIDSDYDKKIIKRETTRIESIARNAMNNSDVLIKNSNEFGG